MKLSLLLTLAVIYILSTIATCGMVFRNLQASQPTLPDENRRQNLGFAVLIGMLLGAAGPVGVLVAWLLSGFAENGWGFGVKKP